MYTIAKDGALDSVVRLTRGATRDDAPSWSPDGAQIFYSSDSSGYYDLWMIGADGSNPVQLTDDDYFDSYPDYWAP